MKHLIYLHHIFMIHFLTDIIPQYLQKPKTLYIQCSRGVEIGRYWLQNNSHHESEWDLNNRDFQCHTLTNWLYCLTIILEDILKESNNPSEWRPQKDPDDQFSSSYTIKPPINNKRAVQSSARCQYCYDQLSKMAFLSETITFLYFYIRSPQVSNKSTYYVDITTPLTNFKQNHGWQ